MRTWKNVLGLLLLFLLCASLLTACNFVATNLFPPPSKEDIIAYVEENYGETPRIISTESTEEKTGNSITSMHMVYTLQINEDDPVEFTVESSWWWGNYGPNSRMKDFHNRDIAVSKEEAAKELAGAFGVNLETEPGDYESTITLYLNQESQLSEITRILSELDDLYSFVYTEKGVKIYIEIVLQTGEDEKIAETINFEEFRLIFNTDMIHITAIESLFKVKRKESLTLIRRAIYESWSEETGYTFEEIYPPPNPLQNDPNYWHCGDCYGRGATGWGKNRVDCPSCDGMGFVPRVTENQEDNGTN